MILALTLVTSKPYFFTASQERRAGMLATLRSSFGAKLIIAAETMTQLERMDKLN